MSKYNFNIYITSDIIVVNAESQVNRMTFLYELDLSLRKIEK